MSDYPDNYSKVAKFFHWTIALLIILNLAIGVVLAYFEEFSRQIDLFSIHKQIGTMILFLVALRVIWRLTHHYPTLDGLLPKYERKLAYLGHFILYVMMFALPISGIYLSQSAGREVYWLSFKLPTLIAAQDQITAQQFVTFHKYLAILITIIVAGHVLDALKHLFIDKNQIMRRMLPTFKRK
ncbi:MAG: cytochrome b [Legionellales bacterium]|nr:cytochrome b [Legionellales bacterium]